MNDQRGNVVVKGPQGNMAVSNGKIGMYLEIAMINEPMLILNNFSSSEVKRIRRKIDGISVRYWQTNHLK